MPYTPVSCGTGHSSRGTRTMPYAYWGSEYQSKRAPAFRENAFWSRVLDCGSEIGMHRWDIQESEQMITTEGQIMSSCKEIMILLFNSTILQGDCHFVKEFFHFERRTENNQSQLSHRETDRLQRLSTTNQLNSTRKGQLYNKGITFRATIPFHASGSIFLCPQFVFGCHLWAFLLSSRHKTTLELRLLSIWPTDFDQLWQCNQDFVAPALCHMPIEVVSVRVEAPAWRENAFWSCVLDSSSQRWGRHSEADEGIRGRPKVDQKVQWNQGNRGRDAEMNRQNSVES
jgi:hypothetical protein